jgi:hypothetical protein
LIDVYQPGTLDGRVISGTEQLAATDPLPPASWWPYHDTTRFDPYREQIAALGYARLMHKYYFNPIRLDLFALPGTHIGDAIDTGDRFDGRWYLPPGSTVEQDSDGDVLTLRGSNGKPTQAELHVASSGAALITAAIESRSPDGGASAFLTCLDAGRKAVDSTEPAALAEGDWHTQGIAALCPVSTETSVLSLRVTGDGVANFRVPRFTRARLLPGGQ